MNILALDHVSQYFISNKPNDNNINFYCKKIGNIVGHTVSFFKRQETKTATLIGLWALETFTTLFLILNINSLLLASSLILMHAYSSYSLFSTISTASTKTNG